MKLLGMVNKDSANAPLVVVVGRKLKYSMR